VFPQLEFNANLFEIETFKRRKNTNKWVNSTLKLERFFGITGNMVIKLLKLPAKYVNLKVRGPSKFVQRKFDSKSSTKGLNHAKQGLYRAPIINRSGQIAHSESNPSTTTRELSVELQTSSSTIFRRLKMLEKINRSHRDVPHDLTQQQEGNRWYKSAKNFLKTPMMNGFWSESLRVMRSGSFWTTQTKKDSGLTLRNQRYPYPDATVSTPSICCVFEKKCEELKLELLPHPAYSPDLAPSDYYLFRSMAHFLKERRFENVDDIRNSCQQFFESKDKSWYRTEG
jgi:hypothetical protein